MDIMLERILSLIPRKDDGKFVHGALKEFANSIGLKSGNLVSDWINGRSTSYEGYIYKIADIYNVSVEWLKGESGIKEKSPTNIVGEANDPVLQELLTFIENATDDERQDVLDYIAFKKSRRGKDA